MRIKPILIVTFSGILGLTCQPPSNLLTDFNPSSVAFRQAAAKNLKLLMKHFQLVLFFGR
jgi:hypothetical protein